MQPMPPWEDECGVLILRLYQTALCPDWPRVVLLDLTAEQFEEFHKEPLKFASTYKLFPPGESASWTSHVAMPPIGRGIPSATKDSRWLVGGIHTKETIVTFCACPHQTTKKKRHGKKGTG